MLFILSQSSSMTIVPVSDKQTSKDFLEVARFIYKNDKNWICPLDQDINTIFNPDKNPFFKHRKCQRWLLKDNND